MSEKKLGVKILKRIILDLLVGLSVKEVEELLNQIIEARREYART